MMSKTALRTIKKDRHGDEGKIFGLQRRLFFAVVALLQDLLSLTPRQEKTTEW